VPFRRVVFVIALTWLVVRILLIAGSVAWLRMFT